MTQYRKQELDEYEHEQDEYDIWYVRENDDANCVVRVCRAAYRAINKALFISPPFNTRTEDEEEQREREREHAELRRWKESIEVRPEDMSPIWGGLQRAQEGIREDEILESLEAIPLEERTLNDHLTCCVYQAKRYLWSPDEDAISIIRQMHKNLKGHPQITASDMYLRLCEDFLLKTSIAQLSAEQAKERARNFLDGFHVE